MPTEATQDPFDQQATQPDQVASGSDLPSAEDNHKLSSKSEVVAGNTHKAKVSLQAKALVDRFQFRGRNVLLPGGPLYRAQRSCEAGGPWLNASTVNCWGAVGSKDDA
jgi:hypothetical protein